MCLLVITMKMKTAFQKCVLYLEMITYLEIAL